MCRLSLLSRQSSCSFRCSLVVPWINSLCLWCPNWVERTITSMFWVLSFVWQLLTPCKCWVHVGQAQKIMFCIQSKTVVACTIVGSLPCLFSTSAGVKPFCLYAGVVLDSQRQDLLYLDLRGSPESLQPFMVFFISWCLS